MPEPYFFWLVMALVIIGLVTVARWLWWLVTWLARRAYQ